MHVVLRLLLVLLDVLRVVRSSSFLPFIDLVHCSPCGVCVCKQQRVSNLLIRLVNFPFLLPVSFRFRSFSPGFGFLVDALLEKKVIVSDSD